MYYGFYSKSSDDRNGHVVYLNPDGQKIKVSYATKDPLLDYFKFKWEDKVFVGPLIKLVEINWAYGGDYNSLNIGKLPNKIIIK